MCGRILVTIFRQMTTLLMLLFLLHASSAEGCSTSPCGAGWGGHRRLAAGRRLDVRRQAAGARVAAGSRLTEFAARWELVVGLFRQQAEPVAAHPISVCAVQMVLLFAAPASVYKHIDSTPIQPWVHYIQECSRYATHAASRSATTTLRNTHIELFLQLQHDILVSFQDLLYLAQSLRLAAARCQLCIVGRHSAGRRWQRLSVRGFGASRQ